MLDDSCTNYKAIYSLIALLSSQSIPIVLYTLSYSRRQGLSFLKDTSDEQKTSNNKIFSSEEFQNSLLELERLVIETSKDSNTFTNENSTILTVKISEDVGSIRQA